MVCIYLSSDDPLNIMLALKRSLITVALAILMTFVHLPLHAQQEVSLQLKWSHGFQFAGYYMAKQKGFYEQAGLDVKLLEGQPGIAVLDEVLQDRADFGVGTSSILLNEAVQNLVLLANIFQHSPLVLVALDQGPFFTLHDLAGNTLMLEDGSTELLAYLLREGIALDQLQFAPHSFSINSLLDGEVTAMSAYLTHEVYFLNQAKAAFRIFTPRSVGIDFYGDNLITSRRMASQRPLDVEAFVKASLAGWEYALNHLDETIEVIQTHYAPSLSESFLRYEAESMLQLIRPDLVEIGYINPGRWKHIAEVYQEIGLLESDPQWDKFFFTAQEQTYRQWIVIITLVLLVTFLIACLATYIYTVNKQLRKVLAEQQRSSTLKEMHNNILAMIADDHPLQSILEQITLNVEAFRSDCLCSIMLKADNEDVLVPFAAPSLDKDYLAAIKKVPIAAGVGSCGTAAALRKRVIITDIQHHPDWQIVREALVKTDLHACWSQPIMNPAGQVLATFAIYHRQISSPNEDDIKLIEEVAQLAAIAIDRSKMLEMLKSSEQHHRHLAHHDPLTGLANRVLFSDRVKQAIRLAKREQQHLAILLVDLKDFKKVNDAHGHLIGDKLLCAIATRLKRCIRSSDTLSRYGGDEFVILLQGLTDRSEAHAVEQKLYKTMLEPFMIEGVAITSGCSIGTAYYPEDGLDEKSLTHVADLQMYDHKRQSK